MGPGLTQNSSTADTMSRSGSCGSFQELASVNKGNYRHTIQLSQGLLDIPPETPQTTPQVFTTARYGNFDDLSLKLDDGIDKGTKALLDRLNEELEIIKAFFTSFKEGQEVLRANKSLWQKEKDVSKDLQRKMNFVAASIPVLTPWLLYHSLYPYLPKAQNAERYEKKDSYGVSENLRFYERGKEIAESFQESIQSHSLTLSDKSFILDRVFLPKITHHVFEALSDSEPFHTFQILRCGVRSLEGSFRDFSSITIREKNEKSNTTETIREKNEKSNTTELRVVVISDNFLTKFPEGIFRCDSVEKIDFSRNELEGDLKPFEQLPNLKELDLSHNHFSEFPSVTLPKLEVLKLSHNDLRGFEPTGEFPELRELELSYNNITRFAPQTKLSKLVKLFLSHNRLQAFDPKMLNICSLRVLAIAHNSIRELPPSIDGLSFLRHVNISYNFIERLPESLGNLRLVEALVATDNIMKKLPKSFSSMESLTHLHVERNKLIKFRTPPPKLAFVYASGNKLKSTKPLDISKLITCSFDDNPLKKENKSKLRHEEAVENAMIGQDDTSSLAGSDDSSSGSMKKSGSSDGSDGSIESKSSDDKPPKESKKKKEKIAKKQSRRFSTMFSSSPVSPHSRSEKGKSKVKKGSRIEFEVDVDDEFVLGDDS